MNGVTSVEMGWRGGRGMRDAGGQRPPGRRRQDDALKNSNFLQLKSSAVLAHFQASAQLPVARPHDSTPTELGKEEEGQKPPAEPEMPVEPLS